MHMNKPLHKKSFIDTRPSMLEREVRLHAFKGLIIKNQASFCQHSSISKQLWSLVVSVNLQKVSLDMKFIILLDSKKHKIKSSVRRLVYLTLYDFLHSTSSANPPDSTGDNNLSLSLCSVEATDLITSLLTNSSPSFIDVNYPFLSVRVINSNETELRPISALCLK